MYVKIFSKLCDILYQHQCERRTQVILESSRKCLHLSHQDLVLFLKDSQVVVLRCIKD